MTVSHGMTKDEALRAFERIFDAYPVGRTGGYMAEESMNCYDLEDIKHELYGGNKMEKTVKITGIEEKVSETTGNTYWKVSTSPVLIPKKALFINNKGQAELLEKGKSYNFVYDTNEKGFIQLESFEETHDIHEDMQESTSAHTPDPLSYKETTSLFQTKLNGAWNMWCAMCTAGKEVDLSMIDDFYAKLENVQREKLGGLEK